jgi:serine protease Do
MKRSLTLCITLLLAGSSVALGGNGSTNLYDQDTGNPPRRVTLPNSSFLGVDLGELTRDDATRLKLRDERGALITRVVSETSAAKAGLQKDDVIAKWNGEAIESAAELSRHIRETPAGRTVRLGVIRNGSETEITVTLGNRTDYISQMRARPARARVERQRPERARPDREMRLNMNQTYRMGVSLQSMSPQLAQYFGLSNRNGALVVFVHPDSPAARAGIKAGDVVLSVAGEMVEYPYKLQEVLREKPAGPVEVKVMRDKQERTFTVQVEAPNVSSWVFSTGELTDVVVQVPNIVVPRITVPSIAPLPAFKYRYLSPVRIAIPKIDLPRIKIPPIRMVMPLRLLVNPV